MVITEAAGGRTDVARTDESLGSFGGTEPAPYLLPRPDDTVTVRDEYLRPRFAHDETFEGAHRRVNQAQRVFGQTPLGAAWQSPPSTYVVCADDLGTLPEVPRTQANRTTDTVELVTRHHPFLSHPKLLARTIAELVP
jgi:hypothetical protein